MYQTKGYFASLKGSYYDIGRQQAQFSTKHSELLQINDKDSVTETEFRKTWDLYEEYCPGINEEISGFCDELKILPRQICYYHMSWMNAGCSHAALLPCLQSADHIYVLRNYDFSDSMDDMRLCSTHVNGKYAHTGFSLGYFGRTEGMNDQGLCITNSSCGIPVGDTLGLRKPVKSGFQFWIVIRTLLEECRNVEEALQYFDELPSTYNFNMILTDSSGHAARIEVLDHKKAVDECRAGDDMIFLIACNHAVLPEVRTAEPLKMKNSIIRYNLMQEQFGGKEKFDRGNIKQLLNTEYPHGLAVHNYEEFFGTLHSILFDINAGTLDLSYGSPLFNPWVTLKVGEDLPFEETLVNIEKRSYGSEFWEMVE